MSGISKGGKATGARPTTVSTLGSEGRENEIIYPTMDIRCERYEGLGRQMERSGSQRSRYVPSYTCGKCHDLLCGLARDIVMTAFGLGRINMYRLEVRLFYLY